MHKFCLQYYFATAYLFLFPISTNHVINYNCQDPTFNLLFSIKFPLPITNPKLYFQKIKYFQVNIFRKVFNYYSQVTISKLLCPWLICIDMSKKLVVSVFFASVEVTSIFGCRLFKLFNIMFG